MSTLNIQFAQKQVIEITRSGPRISVPMEERATLLRELALLPGSEVLNRILALESPGAFVRRLPCVDFLWLLKKVGEGDCLPLLELASTDQWQFLLDLETWERDRLDIQQTSRWLDLLQQADCTRLVKWLFSAGENLAYYFFFKSVEVVFTSNKEEAPDLPDGFFSLDGVLHIRVLDVGYRESLEAIIRVMAAEDFMRYQALFLGFAGVLPAELEEEMYRLRSVRLAEQGFLPHEEAIAVYSPLDLGMLKTEDIHDSFDILGDEETRARAPVLPLAQAGTRNLFMDVVGTIRDPLLLDRLRLEFAGLANQILSADGVEVHELDTLVEACKKAARIVNLAIERKCGRDFSSAEKLLRHHALVSHFRVGFGMVLKLKWEAERWLKGSWFRRQGLAPDFWGEHWGGILKGLLEKRPLFYGGAGCEGDYRDFELPSELEQCLKVLHGLMALDGVLEKLTGSYRIGRLPQSARSMTCHSFFFNLWGRLLLKLEPSFSGLTLKQSKLLLGQLRGGARRPPYKMSGHEKAFLREIMSHVDSHWPEAEDVLSQMWEEFQKEYERMSLQELDPRYSRFITIEAA
jgi:hypothetical protein